MHRSAVLIAARDLFWERGYEGTSIADLEQRTGLNRSSLYLEFGSKRDLFQAALDCYADQIIATLLADVREADAGLEGDRGALHPFVAAVPLCAPARAHAAA